MMDLTDRQFFGIIIVFLLFCLFLLWLGRPKKWKTVASTDPNYADDDPKLLDNLRLECVRTMRIITITDGAVVDSRSRNPAENESAYEIARHKMSHAIRLDIPVKLTQWEAVALSTNLDLLLRHRD